MTGTKQNTDEVGFFFLAGAIIIASSGSAFPPYVVALMFAALFGIAYVMTPSK